MKTISIIFGLLLLAVPALAQEGWIDFENKYFKLKHPPGTAIECPYTRWDPTQFDSTNPYVEPAKVTVEEKCYIKEGEQVIGVLSAELRGIEEHIDGAPEGRGSRAIRFFCEEFNRGEMAKAQVIRENPDTGEFEPKMVSLNEMTMEESLILQATMGAPGMTVPYTASDGVERDYAIASLIKSQSPPVECDFNGTPGLKLIDLNFFITAEQEERLYIPRAIAERANGDRFHLHMRRPDFEQMLETVTIKGGE